LVKCSLVFSFNQLVFVDPQVFLLFGFSFLNDFEELLLLFLQFRILDPQQLGLARQFLPYSLLIVQQMP